MSNMGSVLVIDSDEARRQQIETLLAFLGWSAHSGAEVDGLAYLDGGHGFSAVILGTLSTTDEAALLSRYPRIPFITCQPGEPEARNLIGGLSQPYSYEQLTRLLHYCQSFNAMHPVLQDSYHSQTLLRLLVGKGNAIQEVRTLIGQVADKEANVLILGESGTGKEVVARAIHELSARAQGPFVPVNCGAIPGDLLESELFGHEKGAFTGAISARRGRFELAEGGTLFLDEIGDMPMPMQVKLLRVLQERTFERVGGSKPLRADVRIIAATHRNLEEMIAKGTFRQDLYYRLNVVAIEMPPLRQRREDIPQLAHHFLRRYGERNRKSVQGFTPQAMDLLIHYDWPGNIRELENAVERAVVLLTGEYISERELPLAIVGTPVPACSSADDVIQPLVEVEKEVILAALEKTGGNKTEAARQLGITRKTLLAKLSR